MMDAAGKFGRTMHRRREQSGMSRAQLAARLGCTARQVWWWETRSKRGPRQAVRNRIFDALQMTDIDRSPLAVVGPCEFFRCPMLARCEAHQLACVEFQRFVESKTCEAPQDPQPTRAIYLQVFSARDED